MGKKKQPTQAAVMPNPITKKVQKESPPVERSKPIIPSIQPQRPVAAPIPPTQDPVRPPLVRPGLPKPPLLRPLGMPGAPPLPLNMMGLVRPSVPLVPAVLPPNSRSDPEESMSILPGMPTTPVRGKAPTGVSTGMLPPAGMPLPQPPRGVTVPKNVRVPPQPTAPAGMPQPLLPLQSVPKTAEKPRSPLRASKNGTEDVKQKEIPRVTEKRGTTATETHPKLSEQLAIVEKDQIRQKDTTDKRPRSRSPRRHASMLSAEPSSGPIIVKSAVGQVPSVPFILAEVSANEKLMWAEDLISIEERRAFKLGVHVGL